MIFGQRLIIIEIEPLRSFLFTQNSPVGLFWSVPKKLWFINLVLNDFLPAIVVKDKILSFQNNYENSSFPISRILIQISGMTL